MKELKEEVNITQILFEIYNDGLHQANCDLTKKYNKIKKILLKEPIKQEGSEEDKKMHLCEIIRACTTKGCIKYCRIGNINCEYFKHK